MPTVSAPLDWVGINYYTRSLHVHGGNDPRWAKSIAGPLDKNDLDEVAGGDAPWVVEALVEVDRSRLGQARRSANPRFLGLPAALLELDRAAFSPALRGPAAGRRGRPPRSG